MKRAEAALLVGLSVVLLFVSLSTRSLWPIDETRYLSVAWEMWLQGDFLVPHLNGQPYADKPPLFFWLVQAGWEIFGVQEWWPRLIPMLFSVGALFLVARIARLVWPQRGDIAFASLLILGPSQLRALWSTFVLFHVPLAFFVLVGILGIVSAWRGDQRDGCS
jgi:4-amino-4-deoxy-L-arabinose transferase-like glycosyltransferase